MIPTLLAAVYILHMLSTQEYTGKEKEKTESSQIICLAVLQLKLEIKTCNLKA